jgi:hypothetical protein
MAFTYNTVGISGFSGASNGSITATYNNTFTPGQAIYRTTGGYALAQANAISSCDVIGIVQTANSTSFTAVANGYMTGLTGLVDATEYYLSDQTAGLLTSTAPSANGSIIKPLLISTSTSTGVVVEYPGVQIGASNYGTSGYHVKWTGNTTIGNSIVQDNGTTAIIGGNLSATGNFYALNSYSSYLSAVGVSATNLTVAGTISANGWVSEMAVTEYTTVSAAAPGSTIQFDTLTQSILLYTSNVANNWTLNVRGNSTTPLSSILNVGQTITLTLMTSAAGTGYYQTGMTIDSVSATAKWQNGSAPTSGDTSAMDIYSYSITRVSAVPSYVVLASVAKFA